MVGGNFYFCILKCKVIFSNVFNSSQRGKRCVIVMAAAGVRLRRSPKLRANGVQKERIFKWGLKKIFSAVAISPLKKKGRMLISRHYTDMTDA